MVEIRKTDDLKRVVRIIASANLRTVNYHVRKGWCFLGGVT